MTSAEHYPLFLPGEARRAFGSEDDLRRIAHLAQWGDGSRILELCPGPAVLYMAREVGCTVVAVDSDGHALEGLRERVRTHVISDRVELRQASFDRLPFSDAEFDGIVAVGRVPLKLATATRVLRRYLARDGRIALTYPVRVGRTTPKAPMELWEKRLGESLMLPRELLEIFELEGYEPESLETLDDLSLDAYYRALEPVVAKLPAEASAQAALITEEIELHRSQGGRSSFSFCLAIARRKEPGEPPPAARGDG